MDSLSPFAGLEELWSVDVATGSREVVDVPQGYNLRISQVTCEPLAGNPDCRMGVSCAVAERLIPLCAVESYSTATTEFYVPEGYRVELRVDDLRPSAAAPASKKRKRSADADAPKNTMCRVTLSGSMTACLPPLPVLDQGKTVSTAAKEKPVKVEPPEARPSPKNSPKIIPVPPTKTPPARSKPSPKAAAGPAAKRQKSADSDATIELDTLTKLPSSWAVMSHEQKLTAIKRIRDGDAFVHSDDSEEVHDDDLDSDDIVGGMEEGEEEDEWLDAMDMEEDFEEDFEEDEEEDEEDEEL
eukprot:TRINITY_DN13925_c0_g1_i2.p1 TRINITY_DN13925_c0_g1~~TRINITY_DN13925_c0_g1_i2.p1  ORF type:complete len:313 (+),score=94.43 TRINITY_DN13925_c0_g1_i2:44-940(+)